MVKTKIVVIDDEINIRETISDILTMQGYEVITASGGKEGCRLIRLEKPDMVLCDIMMPDMDGYEVLKRVRSEDHLKSLPFLFVSAKNDAESVRLGMNLGSDDYLTKPFKATELVEAIESKLQRFKQFKESLQQEINSLQDHFSKYGFQELNVPVNGMMGVVDFMQEYDQMLQSSERLELLGQLRNSIVRLRRSYTNLLLYLKLVSGERVYDAKWTCLSSEVLELVKAKLKHFYPEGYTVQFDLAEARLPIHEQAFKLILFELSDNANKFGGLKEQPMVRGFWSEDQQQYHLLVQDHGKGLDASELNKVLSAVRANRDLVEEHGWGLGLYLAKHLAEQAGATFQIKSKKGSGTTIEVVFSFRPKSK
jgi:CheY-like chemotaxis protein/two-component sensor histidine kinase